VFLPQYFLTSLVHLARVEHLHSYKNGFRGKPM
jgi:hypothetical protein